MSEEETYAAARVEEAVALVAVVARGDFIGVGVGRVLGSGHGGGDDEGGHGGEDEGR